MTIFLPCFTKNNIFTTAMSKTHTYFLLFSLLFVFSINYAQQQVVVVEGTYQGKDVYVRNPDRKEGVGRCVSKVTVNGEVTTDEINSSSFIIDLSLYQFLIGDKVEIKIYHAKGCKPKISNPESLKPRSTYVVEEINVDDEETLTWETTGETGKLTFVIEQFKWNEWVKVGEVEGIGTPSVHSYKFKVKTHSGENKFRVYQKDYRGKKRVSRIVTYNSSKSKITFYPKKVRKDIIFSGITSFEVIDHYGNLVKKGSGTKVDCSNLKKGFYYLKFDNTSETFNKK